MANPTSKCPALCFLNTGITMKPELGQTTFNLAEKISKDGIVQFYQFFISYYQKSSLEVSIYER